VKQKRNLQTGAERQTVVQKQTNDDEKDKKTLNVLVKADVLGSLEAIIGSLEKIKHDEVGVKIVGKGLGNITDDEEEGCFLLRFNNSNGVAMVFFSIFKK
jgi:translation initiation factor IF-2